MYNMIKVKWAKGSTAIDSSGSAWVKTWDFEDLPELVTIEANLKPSKVKGYVEGRFGHQLKSWSYWSAATEAHTMAEQAYSSDPV